MKKKKKLIIEIFNLKADLVQSKHDLEREVDRCEGLYERLFEQEREMEKLERKIDKAIDKIEDIKMMTEFDNCKANMILNEVQEILEEDK